MKFYRYENVKYTDRVRVQEIIYDFVKETPKGYWIDWWGEKKWVSKTAKKRWAYPTKNEAKINFVARKNRQIEILTYRLKDAKDALYYADIDIKLDDKINKITA